MASYQGKITTTGKSEAIRFEKALFRSLPAFQQRAAVRAHVLGPRTFLVTLEDTPADDAAQSIESDPVVHAYLDFIERDMVRHPGRLTPFTEADIARIQALTQGVTADDDDLIPDDITL